MHSPQGCIFSLAFKEGRMKKDLELMLKLQEMDYDIDELERSKSYLPEMINKLKGEIDEITSALTQAEQRIKQLNIDKKN